MEQMYLIEIFIDKVTIYASEEENSADKKLIIKIKFGPKVEFIIKEGQLALNEKVKDDIIAPDENGKRKWSRTIRVGKSYLFPSYPDTILMILSKFPLEIEIFNDDEGEVDTFIGVGTMHWDTEFFHMLKETTDTCKPHQPLSIKQNTILYGECYCKQVGEIDFILRLSALGESIITEFQQLMKDPDSFVFRTNKAPSMFQCKRIEDGDPNFCMVGSLYESTTLEDPTIADNSKQKLEVCTDLQSCAIDQNNTCMIDEKPEDRKEYPIDKIRMGDITGPCGNTYCPLAHKVKTYIRNLPSFKEEFKERYVDPEKQITGRKVCGACICKDDRWHREGCPEKENTGGNLNTAGKANCSHCQGTTNKGETCEDKKDKLYGTGATPKTSPTQVAYVTKVIKDTSLKEYGYGKQYTLQSLNYITVVNCCEDTANCSSSSSCQSLDSERSRKLISQARSAHSFNNHNIYNFQVSESKRKLAVLNCLEIANNKDCKCSPPKPAPPCKNFGCNCILESVNIAARKAHKPYCPSFKHKENCPVTLMCEENESKIEKDDENETEPLPYGLPPIKLGPCPVLGRPCTVPDGFARMYKTATLPALPPSYSDAGKVCCSKDFERIKEAIKEYMKNEKEDDYRCVNQFYVDTERRCCDKEQTLLSLMGKACCGSHKMAIQEKFKDEKKT